MQPYVPNKLPLKEINYEKLICSVGEANAQLSEYNGLLQSMINPKILLSPITRQEAILSSKIEGTQTTIEEVLGHEAGKKYDERKEQDIEEVLNYRKALVLAQDYLVDRPIRLNLILDLHKILMTSVRGEDKSPGEFRKNQNWIGPYNCPIEEATFVPPNPLQLHDYLREWESYLEFSDFDILAQSAIVHAQFELLHPFKDGNGRIGRLLIPLFLYKKQRLSSPMFYLSDYLEKNRDEYYERLKAISAENDWTGWILFYLNAVISQAKINNKRTKSIMKLYEDTKDRIKNITHTQYNLQILDAIFDRPLFKVGELAKKLEIPKATAHGIFRNLEKDGMIKTIRKGSGSRPALVVFPSLINIAEGKTVF